MPQFPSIYVNGAMIPMRVGWLFTSDRSMRDIVTALLPRDVAVVDAMHYEQRNVFVIVFLPV
jgi:hypothetical protein